MSNPFVFAVMNAFRGKLPKPETQSAKTETRDEKKSSSSDALATPPPQREG